jgi:hypothetical protein
MTSPDTVLFLKGLELNNRILDLSHSVKANGKLGNKLILSFDLYCLIIKYFLLLYHEPEDINASLEEILLDDNLQIEVSDLSLTLEVNFFSPPNTVILR